MYLSCAAHLGDEFAVVGGFDFGQRVRLGGYEIARAGAAVRRARVAVSLRQSPS